MVKKKYVKSRRVSKVTFEIPESELPESIQVKSIYLVGDFNGWEAEAMPMKREKNGRYRLTVELEPGRQFEYRYLVNGQNWCNDWHADSYVPNGFGEDNCVVQTPGERVA